MQAITKELLAYSQEFLLLYKDSCIRKYVNLTGDKRYELSNHLGNVLVVINDKKIPEFEKPDMPETGLVAFNADVLSYSDYYPFGMLQEARQGSKANYRYGFNGMEKDDELKGEGNHYDYGMRVLDPRVGRFFSVDPLAKSFPELTPYQFASNTPIWAIDLDGLEAYFSNEGVFQKWGENKTSTAQVIVDNKTLSLNVSQMLDRAHWNYGEGGGTMPDQLANALNNRSKMLGEEKMYAGMTTKAKRDKNPITPSRQKQIYFEQSVIDSKETVNQNYKDFNRLFRNDEVVDFNPKPEKTGDKFKIREMQKALSSTIRVLSGSLKDDLDGAAYWASGPYGESSAINSSLKGSTITKVNQTTAYGFDSTHWFFNFKKPTEPGNTKDNIKEIKLAKPKL